MSGPIYDITGKTFFAFSDEEGGAPFIFPVDDSMGPKNDVIRELSSVFTFNDGLIADIIDSNVVLGFLGDLIDNQDHSIRAMKAMIDLKQKYNERVILIGGNRDFNKIRYGVELFFTVDGELPWNGTSTFNELYEKLRDTATAVFRQTDVPEYLQGAVAPWNTNLAKPNSGIRSAFLAHNFKKRLETIMGPTMATGTPTIITGPVAIAKELNTLMGIPLLLQEGTLNETDAKFVCVFQMLMALPWSTVPEYLMPFNSLYLKYLEAAHIGALFKMGAKVGYMSHAGLPYKMEGNILTRGLTAPLGLPYSNRSLEETTLSDMVIFNEAEKNRLLSSIGDLITMPYTSGTDSLIAKFVHLTAGTHPFDYEGGAPYKPYETAPIVNYGRPINRIGNLKLNIGNMTGGAAAPRWLNTNRKKMGKSKLKATTGETLDYDIFGHQPQGFLPTAFKQDKTLHVCLDISKLETGGTNNYSFAFLVLNSESEKFIGRIRFPETPSTIYNTTESARKTSTYKNKVVYYVEPIIGNALPGRKIPGTDIHIQYTPKPPPIFQERAVIRNIAEGNLGRINTSLFTGGARRKTHNKKSRRRHTQRRMK